jgi:RTX calcium-binding nonapeptide repeat (4 copies)
VFVWNPGDGSDVVEGQAGNDSLLFNGANVGEKFDFSANGPRLRFVRDIGGIVMDTDGVEKVSLNELGDADLTTVNDLTGTAVTELDLNLAATGGGGDGAIDTVIVNATSANDAVILSGAAGSATVLGLNTTINITGTEVTDSLHVNGLAGDDAIEASSVGAGSIGLVLSGGEGDDVLIGGAGDDQLRGDAGDDLLIGGLGQDALDGGTGNNTLIQ